MDKQKDSKGKTKAKIPDKATPVPEKQTEKTNPKGNWQMLNSNQNYNQFKN
ncbi:MAG: hypothetical protein LIO58_04095 [Oscillospiraceae bacterium]|nr:hypothetical protein [Oscillospiraceae bacterium]